MHLTRNRVGPDVWDTWPPEARAAIEELEALVGATRTTLRVMFEQLHFRADIQTSHQEDIARKAFLALVQESRPLKPVEAVRAVKEPVITQESLTQAYGRVREFLRSQEKETKTVGVSLPTSPSMVTGREL